MTSLFVLLGIWKLGIKGKERAAWDFMAEELRKDSAKQGPKSVISRNGEACRARMTRLLEAHRVSLLLVVNIPH